MGRHAVSSRRCPRRAPLGSLGALGSPFRSTLSGWSNPAGYGRCCRLPFTPWPPRLACAESGPAPTPAEPWRREGDCRHALSPWRCPRGINRKICIFAPVPAGAARRKENPGMANTNLAAARTAKNDEFYTQYHDIEAEMNAYLDYDPDTFRDKTVLLPCDDPEWSSFTRYFAARFRDLGLKRLISTSYAPESKRYRGPWQPTIFETRSPRFRPARSRLQGKIFTLDRDANGDGRIDIDDLQWDYLEGDGDFRGAEVTALRAAADIIITNPPFSLFREFLAWVVAGG